MAVRSIRDIAVAARGRRQELALSQAELARRAGVSRKWISEFEAGKPTAELGLVLRVLDELGFRLDLHGESSPTKSRDRDSVDLDTLLERFRHPAERRRR
jgi:HTH-type transcriptional regulator / antitoxin HipB